MKFFSGSDVDIRGKVKSEYPVWYHEQHVEQLRESLEQLKRSLNAGNIPADMVGKTKGEIAVQEEKLNEIQRSAPQLSIAEREKLQRLWKEELCPVISESLFSRSLMQKGLASPQEEARRMVKPVLPVKTQLLADMLMETGAKLVEKKTSRNSFVKLFKLIGRLIGENTNVEILRAD